MKNAESIPPVGQRRDSTLRETRPFSRGYRFPGGKKSPTPEEVQRPEEWIGNVGVTWIKDKLERGSGCDPTTLDGRPTTCSLTRCIRLVRTLDNLQ